MRRAVSADSPGTPPDALSTEIERLLGGPPDDRRLARLGEALHSLHDRFVSEQAPEDSAARYLDDGTTLAAYLSYFLPASQAQVRRAVAEVPPPEAPVWRLLDVGSGPGPAALAIADWAQGVGARVELTALEASTAAIESLRRLWPGALTATAWSAGAPIPAGPFEIVVLSHVLNELFAGDPNRLEKRQKLVSELARRVAPGGYLVLIEPALRRTGRELMVMRDKLVAGGFIARAPCLFQGNCPAIARPRDWCHADRPWSIPAFVERAATAAGLSRESLKFSYVILSPASPGFEKSRDTGLFRIVSEPLPENGKRRYFGCGPAGRHALTRLDKDRSDSNAAFDDLERGDVVHVTGLNASGDGRRLTPESQVEVQISAVERDKV